MLLHMKFFGPVRRGEDPAGYRDACNAAFEDFTSWRRTHKIHSSQKRFSYFTIFKDEYGCYFNTKGFNARVLSSWLEDALERSQQSPPPGMVADDRAYLSLAALTFGL